MKNCDEMVNDLLVRREQYLAERKHRRRVIARAAASACCVCLVALAGFLVWRNEKVPSSPTEQAAEPVLSQQSTGTTEETTTAATEERVTEDRIVIHPCNGVSLDVSNIDLSEDDFVEMSRDEMIDYYGVDYIPDVPSDVKPWAEESCGVYRRDGKVYWDADMLNYFNEDFTRRVHLEVCKEVFIVRDYLPYDGSDEMSVIRGVEMFLTRDANGGYYADFFYQNVEFLLSTQGLSEDEFLAILASLIA